MKRKPYTPVEYFDKQAFYNSLVDYRSQLSCADLSANALPDNVIGHELMQLADKIASCRNFARYPQDLKNDMKSRFYQKAMRGLVLYDLSRGADYTFSYFTRTCWLAFLDVIGKHYKNKELNRNYMRHLLEQKGMPSAQVDAMCAEYEASGECKGTVFGTRKNQKKREQT